MVARHDATLFRRIIDFGRSCYQTDRATYHVSATLESAPETADVRDTVVLEREYLELWSEVPAGRGFTKPGRQILHCTFGSTLTNPELGPAIRAILDDYPTTWTEVLAEHFGRHLQALQDGM